MPTLELGVAENKRLIAFKTQDELLSKGKGIGSRKQKATVLRAATAINGRIVPTIEHANDSSAQEGDIDDNLAGLPEHILEQIPNDLLPGGNEPKLRHPNFSFG